MLNDSSFDDVVEVEPRSPNGVNSSMLLIPPSKANSSVPKLNDSSTLSVIDVLCVFGKSYQCKFELHPVDWNSLVIRQVPFLPCTFNDMTLFELPPFGDVDYSNGQMHGTNKIFDGHVWTTTKTSNIINQSGLVFRKSLCVSHLQLGNEVYNHLLHKSTKNETESDGSTNSQFSQGCFPLEKSPFHC